MADKELNLLMNGLPDLCIYYLSLFGDSKMYKCVSIANSQRILTEINKTGAIIKVRILAKQMIL